MKIVIAADSFKGSATSKEVAEYIEKGINNVCKDFLIKKVAIADGGEGTVEAVVDSVSGQYIFEKVHGPFEEMVNAKYGIINENTAVMEMAESSGIILVKREELNPFKASTYGVGEVLKSILDKGIRKIYIGLGGSATNDGGAGMLASLGAEFYDCDGNK